MISSSSEPHNNASWYLIHCQPRKESYAAHAIEIRLGLFIYVPEYKQRYHGSIKHLPFFPGYIFVQADLQKVSLSEINACPGVLHLVAFGGDPQPVPHTVIEEIAERLKHTDMFKNEPFCSGDAVRVKHGGPLQDLEMIFVGSMTGSSRVCVLLNLLGRLKQVHLDTELLEKVSSRTASEQDVIIANDIKKRYTRGKGRRIRQEN